MPNDLRINPFIGTNFVRVTEKHIVPNVSPFVIRTNEVPERHDPSNVEMTYVSEATGKSNGVKLTEVAAMPRQGEYRLDYATGTMGDESWNTGLVEFNEGDAGKIIEIKYTGTGTLAGVKSNHYPAWMTDYGDGSDGDFTPEVNTNISGVKNYRNVFIKAGVTVTIDGNAIIKCTDTFINQGNIVVTPGGGQGGLGPGVFELYGSRAYYQGSLGVQGAASSGGAGGSDTYRAKYPVPGVEKTYPKYDAKSIFLATEGVAYGSGGSGETVWMDE